MWLAISEEEAEEEETWRYWSGRAAGAWQEEAEAEDGFDIFGAGEVVLLMGLTTGVPVV